MQFKTIHLHTDYLKKKSNLLLLLLPIITFILVFSLSYFSLNKKSQQISISKENQAVLGGESEKSEK